MPVRRSSSTALPQSTERFDDTMSIPKPCFILSPTASVTRKARCLSPFPSPWLALIARVSVSETLCSFVELVRLGW